MANKKQDYSVHMAHCNIGEYKGSCKYGEANCPALKDKREGWLRNLKAGDTIVSSVTLGSDSIVRVTGITPTGKIKVISREDGPETVYSPQGYHRVPGRYTGSSRLEPLTQEFLDNRRISTLKYKITEVIERRNHIDFDREDLEQVWNILKKYMKKEDK